MSKQLVEWMWAALYWILIRVWPHVATVSLTEVIAHKALWGCFTTTWLTLTSCFCNLYILKHHAECPVHMHCKYHYRVVFIFKK